MLQLRTNPDLIEYGPRPVPVVPNWRIRPYRESDLIAVVNLSNAAAAEDGIDTRLTEEIARVRLAGAFPQTRTRVLLAVGREVLGFGVLRVTGDTAKHERIFNLSVRVGPGGRHLRVGQELAGSLFDIARKYRSAAEKRRAIRVRSMVLDRQEWNRRLLEQLGMRRSRLFWEMVRPLNEPVDHPASIDGLLIRNYRRPEDNPSLLEAINSSPAGYFDSQPIQAERFEPEVLLSTLRPEISWVAEVASKPGKIAGFSLGCVYDEENLNAGRLDGWVQLLGTLAEWRGRGLERNLLLRSLLSFKEVGLLRARLAVEAAGLTGANRLYESAGFRPKDLCFQYECLI